MGQAQSRPGLNSARVKLRRAKKEKKQKKKGGWGLWANTSLSPALWPQFAGQASNGPNPALRLQFVAQAYFVRARPTRPGRFPLQALVYCDAMCTRMRISKGPIHPLRDSSAMYQEDPMDYSQGCSP
ncbi:hypothetical protein AMTR_s00057p00200000 [Amborella trichopoda]|uniref:Uncharacterized protein n=1 Tax=Amborella trichopoda TaxID=13333 RepID=U5D401_AMBTC|nr:hypothetical protein AMTR_s00057p00200000 [Amborella trichopoda]